MKIINFLKSNMIPLIIAFLRLSFFILVYESVFISPQSSTDCLAILSFAFVDPVFGILELLSLFAFPAQVLVFDYFNFTVDLPFIFICGILGTIYWFFITKYLIIFCRKVRTLFLSRKNISKLTS